MWENVPPSALVYLDSRTGPELIHKAIRKAGSKRSVIKDILLYEGRSPDVTKLNKIMRGEYGLPTYRFIRLISFIAIPTEKSVKYVRKICTRDKKVLHVSAQTKGYAPSERK